MVRLIGTGFTRKEKIPGIPRFSRNSFGRRLGFWPNLIPELEFPLEFWHLVSQGTQGLKRNFFGSLLNSFLTTEPFKTRANSFPKLGILLLIGFHSGWLVSHKGFGTFLPSSRFGFPKQGGTKEPGDSQFSPV